MNFWPYQKLVWGCCLFLWFTACQANLTPTLTPNPTVGLTSEATMITVNSYAEYEIMTVLPRDAIPAVFTPSFLSPAEANEQYTADELVIGVVLNGEAKAYSIPYLSSHEIVNDTVGGIPIAVTW